MFALIINTDQDLNLEYLGFEELTNNIYLFKDMPALFKAVNAIKANTTIRNNIKSIHACKIKDLSDFTDIIKTQV